MFATGINRVGDKSQWRGRFAETEVLKKMYRNRSLTRFFSLIQVTDVANVI